jgi:hypothetical protein
MVGKRVVVLDFERRFSRRRALELMFNASIVSMFGLGCERHRYVRPAGELDLGAVKDLLYTRVHNHVKAVLLSRDADGWSALSTRCTYRGCDLTFQEPVLLCPCSKTRFALDGRP